MGLGKGKFFLKRLGPRGRIESYRVLDGVWFKKSEIRLLVEGLEKAIKVKGNRGRPKEKAKWVRYNVALFDFASNPSNYDTSTVKQESFFEDFYEFYTTNYPKPDPLGDSALKAGIHAIYNFLKDKKRAQTTNTGPT